MCMLISTNVPKLPILNFRGDIKIERNKGNSYQTGLVLPGHIDSGSMNHDSWSYLES